MSRADALELVPRALFASRLAALLRSGFGAGLPRRRRDRWILLYTLRLLFPESQEFDEREVNQRLLAWLADHGRNLATDHVTLRRALVDEGFLERDRRGRAYRATREFERRVRFDPAIGA